MSYEKPFILYNNLLETNTISSFTEDPANLVENAVDGLDWTYYKTADATEPQLIQIEPNAKVDTLAILGHNLGSAGNSAGTVVTVQESNGSGYTSIGSVTITDDNPFYLKLTSSDNRFYRINFSNIDEVISIAVMFLGERMDIPVGANFSFDPDQQDIKSEKYNNYDGRLVGSAVKYSERKMNVPFKRIAQTFIASDVLPFLENHWSQMKPWFFVPDPGDVFGDDKIYYLTAPNNPSIKLPVHNENINYRDWTLEGRGVRQSTFR